jgi:hypothetical protein
MEDKGHTLDFLDFLDTADFHEAPGDEFASGVPNVPEPVPYVPQVPAVSAHSAQPDPNGAEPDSDALDEVDDAPLKRVMVAAADAKRLRPKGPVSVFSMGLDETALALARPRSQGCGRPSAPASGKPKPQFAKVHRADGRVVCVGAGYPSDRWTEERAVAELIRRAKQRPPKPTWRTKSKKLRQMIGE